MRILVIGRSGQIATALAELGRTAVGIEVVTLGRPELDLEDISSVKLGIAAAQPDAVVNAAAYTAVDKAEAEPGLAFAINREGAGAAAAAAAELKLPFVHFSTDYVYPGDKSGPYVETDETGPVSVYGQSKLAGEEAVRAAHPSPLILRTSWVYSPFGANFVKTMLRLGASRPVLNVVDDQTGNPTSALDVAAALLSIAPDLGRGGTYHLCGTGAVTWCGLARAVFSASQDLGGPSAEVMAITTAEFPTAARRPANSRLSTDAFHQRYGFRLPAWQDSLPDVVSRLIAGS